MTKSALAFGLAASFLITLVAKAGEDEIPAPFAKFEGMVGGWKGTARPAANKVRGWPESHSWAWKFVKGTPVGMTLAVEGGKVVSKGEIGFDPKTKKYTLAATTPAGKPVKFVGGTTPDGKGLVLDRSDATPEGKERLTIRPNSSGIRYTMLLDRQAPGAPQYKNAIEVGLTKEGESFAAGGAASDLPKCILTGGAATMTVSYEGKTYPVCCTGCQDAFNEDPAKYVARLLAKAKAGPDAPKAKAARPAPSRGGEFDGLIEEPKGTKPKT